MKDAAGVEGQLSIFDWLPQPKVQQVEQCSTSKCSSAKECEAYPIGCGGTIEPCRFGGPYKWEKEDIKTMTTEKLAELLGKEIDVTFIPFQKHYTARKNGYDITIGFMNNSEGKKVISVDAQYKDRKYGGGSSFDDIADAASYITYWLNRCRYSQHKCNKENLWDIANTLDDIECPRVCCRKCNIRGCGSRCNGSFEPQEKLTTNVKPCECENHKLAVKYTGCGIPIGGYKSYPLIFEHYLYTLFCPKCYRVATSSLEWRSNKTDLKEALKDWNNNLRKVSDTQFINGPYNLKDYAEKMNQTIELFPSIIEILGQDNIYLKDTE